MRRVFILAVLGAVMALAAAPFAQDAPIAIKAETLIDGKGGVRTNVTIVVRDGKITSIGPSTQVPDGRISIRYWPVPSVTPDRTLSISAGLAASTVTLGSTAPDASLTTPVIDA